MFQKKSLVKKVSVLILLFSLILSFTACNRTEKARTATVNYITFTDSLGRTVSVPEGTVDAAVLVGSLADIWRLSGGNILATAEDAWEDFNMDIPDAINLGTVKDPDLELILSSNPPLIIASSNTTSNLDLLPTLSHAGYTVAFFEINSFSDYLKMLKICTDITGRSDLYEKNGLMIKEKTDSVKADFSKKEIPEAEKTYLLLRASSGLIKAKGSSSYVLGGMLKDLGYKNIADSNKTLLEDLSIESIIKEDPYRIFIVQMGDDAESAKENVNNMFYENSAWRSLTAVKEGRVHFMDKRLFSLKPNARWGESYEILTDILEK
ncbi:MAG: ABC transporter substrate-binding protein [Clostridia bacterium]|nr:ABC transporter substrate-binding protein [Clostridia bacterium]